MISALGDVLDTERDHVVVIDDASPDGPGDRRPARGAASVGLRPASRAQGGIGPAYIAGFRWALAEVPSSCSRWTATSRTPGRRSAADRCFRRRRPRPRLALCAWRRDRELGARAPLRVARWMPVRADPPRMRVRDLTGGFKCFRRGALEAIDLDALSAHGYAFQIETTYRVRRAGLRVREVPITFVERRAGASKMTGSIVAEAIWKVPLLRLRACRQALAVGEVTDETFGEEVLASPIPVIVDFWAPWCKPCEAVEPHLRALAAEWERRVRLVRVNVDENLAVSGRYDVLSLPTVILLVGSQERPCTERSLGHDSNASSAARPRRATVAAVTTAQASDVAARFRALSEETSTSSPQRSLRRSCASSYPPRSATEGRKAVAERFGIWNDADEWSCSSRTSRTSPTSSSSVGASPRPIRSKVAPCTSRPPMPRSTWTASRG